MAKIGLGYGSEFQLLRFLGHHREKFESIIRHNTHYKGAFKWLDYPYEKNQISGDGEHKGISFLKNQNDYDILLAAWKDYWPQKGNSQNWDAIFMHGGEYVLIEAKAHMKEMKQSCGATSDSSIKKIAEAFIETKNYFQIETKNNWLCEYYQLANRLAFVKFLLGNNIRASLLNIYFVNGYIKRNVKNKTLIDKTKNVESESDWKKAINIQYEYLGIKHTKAMDHINSVIVNCIEN